MKLTLIKPNIGSRNGLKYKDIGCMEPYALSIIAGLTPPGIDIRFIDERMENIDFDSPTDIVAINVETFTARRAYQIARTFRSRHVTVILGGFHPSLIPTEAIRFADSVVIGEVEPIWSSILHDFRTGNLKKVYNSGYRCDMKGILPDRSIFNRYRYLPFTLTHYSRGCPYSCTYCPDAVLYEGNIRYRPVEDVITDIESQSRPYIFFVDNNISANKQKFKELLRELIPLQIKWVSQADINVGEDDELLDLMKKSGCEGLVVGFETLNPDNLTLMNKPQNIKAFSRYDMNITRIHDHGIAIWAAFLFGYDSDTKDTFKYTMDFALRHKFHFAGFNPLIPYYGTPIYNRLQAEKRLLFDKWWLNPAYRFGDVTFQPKHMTPEELSHGCIDSLKYFSGFPSLLKRSTNFKVVFKDFFLFKVFFIYNMLIRREIRKKEYIELGYTLGSDAPEIYYPGDPLLEELRN